MSADSHAHGFRHTRPDKVSDCRSPQAVEELALQPCLFASLCPCLPEALDRLAISQTSAFVLAAKRAGCKRSQTSYATRANTLSVPSTSQRLAALQPFCVNPKSLPDKANGSLRPDFQKTPPTDTQLGSKRAPNRSLPGQGVHQIAFEPPIRRSTPHLVPNKTPHTNPIYFVHAPSCPKRLSSSLFYPSSPLTKPPTSDPEPVIHHMPSH